MITRHLRLSIDFTITIADTPPPESNGLQGLDQMVYHGHQARLLEALKANPEVLTCWLRSLITDKMMDHGRWDWDDLLMGVLPGEDVDSEKILASVIATLSKNDQEFFRDRGECDFSDVADLFLASFTVEEKPPVISKQEHVANLAPDGDASS